MTFFALLLKEIRLRVRRERLIWLLVIYILILGLLEWLVFSSTSSSYNVSSLNSSGTSIYTTLIVLQFLLTVFIAPAFTASAINAEKERQTYDLLLCSRLSSFSLVGGKLIAGLSSTLMLIAATIPLFSLVFFFGGVDPLQVVQDQVMFIVTAILVATFALFCSALFPRPAVSTAITYMGILLWLIGPYLFQAFALYISPDSYNSHFLSVPVLFNQGGMIVGTQGFMSLAFIWSPLTAFNGGSVLSSLIPIYRYSYSAPAMRVSNAAVYIYSAPSQTGFSYPLWNGFAISSWLTYILLSFLAIAFCFLFSLWLVKPYPLARLRTRLSRRGKRGTALGTKIEDKDTETDSIEKETGTASPAAAKESGV